MARIIFLVTVLAALCYTSQAFPVEEARIPKINMKELIEKLKEKFEKAKQLNPEIAVAAASDEQQFEQYFFKNIFESIGKAIHETLGVGHTTVEELQKLFRPKAFPVEEARIPKINMKELIEKLKEKFEKAKQLNPEIAVAAASDEQQFEQYFFENIFKSIGKAIHETLGVGHTTVEELQKLFRPKVDTESNSILNEDEELKIDTDADPVEVAFLKKPLKKIGKGLKKVLDNADITIKF
ncbi:uncharacterized protein LOC105181258 [Harpegnathos saltator]|uniref:uncharacterized protein LOC105181258 n=1 Tax=Harpegnathos saltator TaxID=610380 RepID=UPI000DBEE728|nr:uncharacterized protein LOC105181258 [Harpegnathos saltator]